jgi:hypothetical protein
VGRLLTGTGSKRMSVTAMGGVLALAALAAAGCSRGTSPSAAVQSRTPAQEIQLAASTAETVNSFTATISVDLKTKGASLGAESVTVAGTMSEEVHPSRLSEFTFSTLKAAGVSLPGGLSEITTPTEVYVQQSELSMLLHTNKQWLGLPVSALSSSSGFNLGSLFSQSDTSSPLTMTQLLAGATGVRKVGTGTVDGVPVTEYTGSYSLATSLDKLPASVRNSASSAFKQAGLDSGDASFTVWIDAQNIVRQETTEISSSTFNENVTFTVTGVNQPVAITAPPASQVFTITAGDLGSTTTILEPSS